MSGKNIIEINKMIRQLSVDYDYLISGHSHSEYATCVSMLSTCGALVNTISKTMNNADLGIMLVNGPIVSQIKDLSVLNRVEESGDITDLYIDAALPVAPKFNNRADNDNAKRYISSFSQAIMRDLRDYYIKNPRDPYSCLVDLMILSVYESEKAMRDYDNVVIKGLIDAVATFLLVDDSPLHYRLHMSAEIGEKSGVIVRIAPVKPTTP